MRIRTGVVPEGKLDLPGAFRFLGHNPTRHQYEIAVQLLREAGVEVDFDDRLPEIAEANGSDALVALDLHAAFWNGVDVLYAGPPGSR